MTGWAKVAIFGKTTHYALINGQLNPDEDSIIHRLLALLSSLAIVSI